MTKFPTRRLAMQYDFVDHARVQSYVSRAIPANIRANAMPISNRALKLMKGRASLLSDLGEDARRKLEDCTSRANKSSSVHDLAQAALRDLTSAGRFSPLLKALKIRRSYSGFYRGRALAKMAAIVQIADEYQERYQALLKARSPSSHHDVKFSERHAESERGITQQAESRIIKRNNENHRTVQRKGNSHRQSSAPSYRKCLTSDNLNFRSPKYDEKPKRQFVKPLSAPAPTLGMGTHARDSVIGGTRKVMNSIVELSRHPANQKLLACYERRAENSSTHASAGLSRRQEHIKKLRVRLLECCASRIEVNNVLYMTNSIAREVLSDLHKDRAVSALLKSIGIFPIRSKIFADRALTKLHAIAGFLDKSGNADPGGSNEGIHHQLPRQQEVVQENFANDSATLNEMLEEEQIKNEAQEEEVNTLLNSNGLPIDQKKSDTFARLESGAAPRQSKDDRSDVKAEQKHVMKVLNDLEPELAWLEAEVRRQAKGQR